MSNYVGRRSAHGCVVRVDGRGLDPRHDLRNHSPTGFEWGYGGSGPAPLALALLAYHGGSQEQRALDLYQGFTWRVVAALPAEGWHLTTADIEAALAALEAASPAPGV